MRYKRLLQNILFYLGMIIQLFYTARIITINSYENSSEYVTAIMLLFSIVILMSPFSKKEIGIFMVLILCSFLHLIITDDTNLFRIVMMLFAGRRINSYSLKRFLCYSYIVLFLSVVLMSIYSGFNSVYQENVWRTGKGWEIRYNLGFDGATRMMFIWICIIVSWQIYHQTRNRLRDAIFFIISIYLFKISVSFTGILGSVLALGVPYLLEFFVRKFGRKSMQYAMHGSLVFVLFLTIVAIIFDISSTKLGVFLNGRTGSLHGMIAEGNYPNLLGGIIPEGAKGLDNSYFYNCYVLGIIPMILMLIAIWKLSSLLAKRRDIMQCTCMITFIFVAYVTQTFEHTFLNYFIFLLMGNWESLVLNYQTDKEKVLENARIS